MDKTRVYHYVFILFLVGVIGCSSDSNTKRYNLSTTAIPSEGGSVTPSSGDYDDGEQVQISASANEDWSFEGWQGDLSGETNPQTITMDADKDVAAMFVKTETEMVYLADNGVTIMCPNGRVGEVGIVDGEEYEVVDRRLLEQRRDQEGDLSRLCVSLVTDMRELFRDSPFNQPIGNWDVSNVTDMYNMFRDSPFNQPLGNWDVSNVTNMYAMFGTSLFNQPIENWDTRNVTDMRNMFRESPFNQPIGNWDVSSVTAMRNMFLDASEFNQPIGNWDVSNVTDMYNMFRESPFNQPIDNWDVSNVTNMFGMFTGSLFNQPIGNWDVSSVTDMGFMFHDSEFNQDISSWCVSRIDTEPNNFSTASPLTDENKPVWGTCPE